MRAVATLAGVLGLAAGAGAQTLSIVPEQTTYAVGEEVVVRLVADGPPPPGAEERAVFARLDFDEGRLVDASVEPVPLTSFGGSLSWIQGAVSCGAGWCDALSAAVGVVAHEVDPPADAVWSVVRFTAAAPGSAELSIRPAQDYYQGSTTTTYTGFGLDFFDQTAAAAATLEIVPAGDGGVPALGPLGAGALALLAAATGVRALRRRGA